MFKILVFLLCNTVVFVSHVSSQGTPLSPCPRIFAYENDGQTWYGIITIGPPYGSDLEIHVKMDIPGTLPSSFIGRLEMLGERSEVVVSLMNGRNIRYKVTFPTLDYIPSVTSIIFNGNQICSGSGLQNIAFTTVTLKHVLNTNLNIYPGYQGPTQQVYVDNPTYPINNFNTRPVQNTPENSNTYPSTNFNGRPVQSYPDNTNTYPTTNFNRRPTQNTGNSGSINPSNPWLTNVLTEEPVITITNQDDPDITSFIENNPWLSGVINQQPGTTSGNPPRQPVDTRPTQSWSAPRPVNRPEPSRPVNRPEPSRPATRPGQSRPSTRPEQSRPVSRPETTYRPPVRQPSRQPPQTIPDSKVDRPNPDTFAVVNRRPTPTPAPATSPVNDRAEVREKCGKSKRINNVLIVRGEATEKGDWPWLAAIFVKKVSSLNFICGGTLASKEIIVTAGHCLGQNNNRQTTKEELIVRLGVHNINDWIDGDAKSYGVNEIIAPPSFDGGLLLKNDIVLLRINKIQFTDYVIPACLWQDRMDVNAYYGKFGTIIGWGRNEDGLIASQEPRSTRQRLVTAEECQDSNPAYSTLTSSTTLCAGNRNGTGPCNGDSGGGLFINIDGRWTLRGIVSNSLNVPDAPNVCNLADFIVYTDVAKFVQWIEYYL